MLNTESKIPYDPSREKRFIVSPDIISRERIKLILDLRESLQGALRIPIAISLFGSLSKGKVLTPETALHADIDLNIYFDRDVLSTVYEQVRSENPAYRTHFDLAYTAALKSSFLRNQEDECLRLSRRKTPIKRKTSSQKSISYGLNEGTKRYIQEFVGNVEVEKGVRIDKEVVSPIAKHGQYSIMGAIMWENPIGAHHYFHLDVGGGLRPYHQAFFEELKQRGDREELWNLIYQEVIRVERNNSIPLSLIDQFPRTFDDASRAYAK